MNTRKFNNLLAYIVLALIAVSVVVNYLSNNIFHWDESVSYYCNNIAFYLACIVTLVSAFYYANSKRNRIFMSLFILFVFVIVVFKFVL